MMLRGNANSLLSGGDRRLFAAGMGRCRGHDKAWRRRRQGRAMEKTHRSRVGASSSLSSWVDFATGSHLRAAGLLIAICFVTLVPGVFQIGPVDRDEARFAQASKQMVESGDYVDIRFQEESRYKKPIGIYWLQAGVVKLAQSAGVADARTTIAYYRLPSLASAVGAVLLTYWAALGFVSRRAAIVAAIMLAVSILLGVEARLAKTDAALLAACVAAMGALGRAYMMHTRAAEGDSDGNTWKIAAIFWTAVAAGILIKGPVILLFVGATVVTLGILDRSVRWLGLLKPAHGLVWLALLVLPWFAAIVSRSGWNFFAESLGRDMLSKVGSGQETHGMPPGFYLVLFWVTFFPGALLAGLVTPAIWAARKESGARFLLAWLIPSWIVFELVVTKLPHYVLPLYPAVAIMIAGVLDRNQLSQRLWLVRGTVWWFLIATSAAAVVVAAHIVIEHQMGVLVWPFAAAAAIFSLRAWWLYEQDGPERSLLRASVAAVILSVATFGITIPQLPQLFPAVSIARYLNGLQCGPAFATAGFHEPSLVFLAGTSTRHTDGTGAADFLYEGACRAVAVEKNQERAFVQRADTIGLRYWPGPRIEGVNIGTGRRVSIAMYRSERAP
jgi:4-amino-4-deoxy-L-arabinose transferase-like glycosyltransferase